MLFEVCVLCSSTLVLLLVHLPVVVVDSSTETVPRNSTYYSTVPVLLPGTGVLVSSYRTGTVR